MGFEFQLSVAAPDPAAVNETLGQLPGARPAATGAGFDYGGDEGGWPEASAQLDENGVYFIYFGTVAGRALLGQLAVALVEMFGTVTLEEL